MLVILNSLNSNNLPIFQPILIILVSKCMVHRALSDKTYLSLGLLSPLRLSAALSTLQNHCRYRTTVLEKRCHRVLVTIDECTDKLVKWDSKIALVRFYVRVPQVAGQVKILIFLVKINVFQCLPICFVMQGKCLFKIFRGLKKGNIYF